MVLTSNNEIINFTLEVNQSGISSPFSKSIRLNNSYNISKIIQHTFFNNKYFILVNGSGAVYVLNKDLELRTSHTYSRSISNVLLDQGLLGVMSHNEIFFLNFLGGGSLLLNCYNAEIIVDSYLDQKSNLLFVIDLKGILSIYSVKVSLAKSNINECYRK